MDFYSWQHLKNLALVCLHQVQNSMLEVARHRWQVPEVQDVPMQEKMECRPPLEKVAALHASSWRLEVAQVPEWQALTASQYHPSR